MNEIVWTAQLRPCRGAGNAKEGRRLQRIEEEAHAGFLPQPVRRLLSLHAVGGQKRRRPGKIACDTTAATTTRALRRYNIGLNQ